MNPEKFSRDTLRVLVTGLSLTMMDVPIASALQSSEIEVIAAASGETDLTSVIAKWPTKESCTAPSSNYRLAPRWKSFASREDLWVCFYRIVSSLETKAELRAWLSQFDMGLIEAKGANDQDILAFTCSKTNRKCEINWNSVDVISPFFLKPYSFSFAVYIRGGRISNFYVSANRE